VSNNLLYRNRAKHALTTTLVVTMTAATSAASTATEQSTTSTTTELSATSTAAAELSAEEFARQSTTYGALQSVRFLVFTRIDESTECVRADGSADSRTTVFQPIRYATTL
jgi:hypothetical protein